MTDVYLRQSRQEDELEVIKTVLSELMLKEKFSVLLLDQMEKLVILLKCGDEKCRMGYRKGGRGRG